MKNTKQLAQKNKLEIKIYGVHAVKAIFKNRPQDIIKCVVTKERAPVFSDLMSYLAKNKKAYHIEPVEKITDFAKSVHHEGVCLLVKNTHNASLQDWFQNAKSKKQLLLLALENIDNPHNLGAIIRSAAHFAVDGIFYTSKNTTHFDASVSRVAQGGIEYVPVFKIQDWSEILDFCYKNAISIFTTSDKAKAAMKMELFSAKSLIVLGNEGEGLSSFWQKVKTTHIKIDGTNKVESLNISVANGILLALYRQKYHLPPL